MLETLMIALILGSLSLGNVLTAEGPYNPIDNPSLYPVNSLTDPASLWNLGGTIPSERIHQSIVNTEEFLIVYGGYSVNGTYLGDVNMYHLKSQTWSGPILRKECCNDGEEEIDLIGAEQLFNLPYLKVGFEGDHPTPRAEHSAAVLLVADTSNSSTITKKGLAKGLDEELFPVDSADKIELMYIFGGSSSDYGYTNDLYSFNPQSLKWRIIDTVDGSAGIPARRAGHSVVGDAERGIFYIFGGRTSTRNNNVNSDRTVGLGDMWMYNAAFNKWSLLSSGGATVGSSPINRQHASMALIGSDKLYVFGGIDPASSMAFNDMWVFHIAERQWERLFRSTGQSYGFIPPPMSNAHIIPFQPLPTSTTGSNSQNNAQAPCDHSIDKTCTVTLLVYGGVGGGGVCGDNECKSMQTVLGQVYRFSVTEKNWIAPHSVTGGMSNTEPLAEYYSPETSGWSYARITSAQYIDNGVSRENSIEINDRGKMIKVFAMEKVVIVPERRLMYEFGGMQVILPSMNEEEVMKGQEGEGRKDIESELQAEFLESSGGDLKEKYHDLKTGESLLPLVHLIQLIRLIRLICLIPLIPTPYASQASHSEIV